MGDGRLHGSRVLVVEDEAMIATLIESILADAGCRVVGPVATVGRALETLERESVDLAVLDISVSGREVYFVADRLVERGIPIVFVSGFSQADMPADYRHHAYLTKPFEPGAMVELLGEKLGRGTLSRAV